MVPVFKNIGKRPIAKNYHPVSLLSVISKVFEKFVNNRIVDHLEKCGLFSDFQYGFRSSRSTADLLTVVSDRIANVYNRSGLLKLWHLIYPRLFVGFSMLVFFTNSNLVEFQIGYLALFRRFSVTSSFGWFWMEIFEEYLVSAGVPQDSILGSTFFLLYINDLLDDVICNIAIYDDDTTLFLIHVI